MTTIVYDGKSLAADTSVWADDTYCGKACKVREVKKGRDEYLIAGAGLAVDLDSFCKKFKDNEPLDTFNESIFICINKNDPTDCCEYQMGLRLKGELPIVIGAGREVVYGAIDAGCDALGAVKVACKRNAFTDYPIDWYTFEDGEWLHKRIER